jgi:hypothetical protein
MFSITVPENDKGFIRNIPPGAGKNYTHLMVWSGVKN